MAALVRKESTTSCDGRISSAVGTNLAGLGGDKAPTHAGGNKI